MKKDIRRDKKFWYVPQQRYLDRYKSLTLAYSTDPKDKWAATWRNYERDNPTDLNGSPCSEIQYCDWSDEAIHADNRAWANPIARLDIYVQWALRQTEGKWEDSIKSILTNGLTLKGRLVDD